MASHHEQFKDSSLLGLRAWGKQLPNTGKFQAQKATSLLV